MCELEQKIESNSLSAFTFESLKRHKLIKTLFQLTTVLAEERKKQYKYFVGEKIHCPFFREQILNECDFLICPYHSDYVKNTNCLLSVNKTLTPDEIAIAKNIPRKILFENISSKETWDTFEELLKKGSSMIATCKKCGQFKIICHKNHLSCSKRQKHIETIINNAFVPKKYFEQYPIILILLALKQTFGDLSFQIFPSKVWKLYTSELNTIKI